MKKLAEQKAVKDDTGNQILATVSTTTVVDPVSGEELIISPSGQNPLDQSVGSNSIKANLSGVINDIEARSGVQPTELTLKVYDASNKLVGSTTVVNPYTSGKFPTGYTANEAVVNGTINYQCDNTDLLRGPGYYGTPTGDGLFGMFCN